MSQQALLCCVNVRVCLGLTYFGCCTCFANLPRLKAYSRVCCPAQFDDQGIVNSDSRTIAVPHDYANYIPTDIRGLTFARTPAQVPV